MAVPTTVILDFHLVAFHVLQDVFQLPLKILFEAFIAQFQADTLQIKDRLVVKEFTTNGWFDLFEKQDFRFLVRTHF